MSGLAAQTVLEQLAPALVPLGARVCILWPQSESRLQQSHVPERPMVKVVIIITGSSRKKIISFYFYPCFPLAVTQAEKLE